MFRRAQSSVRPSGAFLPLATLRYREVSADDTNVQRILVVEDCPEIQELVRRALASEFLLDFTSSLAEAREHVEAATPELVLLDVNLPDGLGYGLCAELQNRAVTRDVPIVFLTSRTATEDKVTAFQLGAEDYVEKPFDCDELRARVAARLRAASRLGGERSVLRQGSLCLDRDRYQAVLDAPSGQRQIDLTPREFRLLLRLAGSPGQVFTREQLCEAMGEHTVVSPRTVDSHVSNLRRKLGGEGPRIGSVRGTGYRLESREEA